MLCYWPCDLDLWPFNPKIMSLLVYPKVIPTPSFNIFGSFIRFWVMLRTNRQTDKQTDGLETPTRACRHIYRRIYQLYINIVKLWGNSPILQCTNEVWWKDWHKFPCFCVFVFFCFNFFYYCCLWRNKVYINAFTFHHKLVSQNQTVQQPQTCFTSQNHACNSTEKLISVVLWIESDACVGLHPDS